MGFVWLVLGMGPLFAQTTILQNGTYEFVAGYDGLALSAQSVGASAPVDQETYTAATNQQWSVTNLGGNTVEIVLAGTTYSLEAPTTVAGVKLDVSRYTGATLQQWNVVTVSTGVIELVNVATGLAVNVSGNSTSPGAQMCQWNANASLNERFAWTLLGGGSPPPPTLYTLTVTNGTGGGSYAAGTVVTVTANAAAQGMMFAAWTGNTSALASSSSSSTTLTMPAAATAITATYTTVTPPPPTLYTLAVTNGSGSGSYAAGTAVTVTANAAPTGMVFAAWTGDTSNLANASLATTTVTMPAAATAITATYAAIPPPPALYPLIVTSGTGSGSYAAGTSVTVTAGTAPAGMTFAGWTGDISGLANASLATTTLTMPAAAAAITATYTTLIVPPTLYTLTVTNGSGSGSYAAGTAVTVTANAAPAGMTFAGWTGNTSALASPSSATTTLTMPAAAAAITATYTAVAPPPPTLYTLTVTNGTGSGSYASGTTVTVTANAAAAGMTFAAWTGSTSALASPSSASTTLTMPAAATAITATYSATTQPPSIIADGTYQFVSALSGLTLASTAVDGSPVVQQIYTSGTNQQWTVTNLGNNTIELALSGTTEALETPTLVAGVNLDVATYDGAPSQQWEVVGSSTSSIELVNVDSGYAINVSGNSTGAGTKMCQWNANRAQNELWSFTAVVSSGGTGSTGTGTTGTGTGSTGTGTGTTGTGTGSTGTGTTGTGTGSTAPTLSFFGVSSDAAQTSNGASWMPVMASAGLGGTRLAAAWDLIEPAQGSFNYQTMDSILANATASNLSVTAILGYSPSWVNTKGGVFPTGSLPDWSTYVGNMVSHYNGKISYWEIWNEPDNNSGATPSDYAQTVTAAYAAAKAANPNAQVGLSASEVNVNWLRQTIVAGAADHFDFITLHPYSVLYNMSQGWEGDYLGIVKTIRTMLAANDPARANVPIIFTEIGDNDGYGYITDSIQAGDLVKSYSMGLAEGVTAIDWFEAHDGDSGPFGLLDSNGNPRPGYHAMKSLTAALGATPVYQGWLQLNSQDYGFVFNTGTSAAMALWAPPGVSDSVTFSASVQVVNPQTEAVTTLPAGSVLTLTNLPVLITGLPADLLATAQANKALPFPWKGNYTGVSSVGIQMGNPNVETGLHQMGAAGFARPTVQGAVVEDVSSASGQNYDVDPNFLTSTPVKLQVTVVVMAKDSSAGFNFKYESLNGWGNIGWNGIPNDSQWHTLTFTPTDDAFVSIWGYNFQLNSDSTAQSHYYLKSVTVKILP